MKQLKPVVIYTKTPCAYCTHAKDYFNENHISFKEIDVTDNDQLKNEMIEKSQGRKTTPQIFIGDQHIGGWDDLNQLIHNGELKKLLEKNF